MAPEAPPAWVVTSQVETVDLGPTGNFQPGVRVSFRTRSGAIGSVFVPTDGYTVERVREAIAARAATLETVAGLQG